MPTPDRGPDEQKMAGARDLLGRCSLPQVASLCEWAQDQELSARAHLALLQEVMLRDNLAGS